MKKRFTFSKQTSEDQEQETEHQKNHGSDNPSEGVLKFLLNYSRSLTVIKSSQFGCINVNLN